jgi:carboxyl-terminal processing protease
MGNPIPEVPNIDLPDPASPQRKRTGLIVAGLAGVAALCCVAVVAGGLYFGGLVLSAPAETVTQATVPPPDTVAAAVGTAPTTTPDNATSTQTVESSAGTATADTASTSPTAVPVDTQAAAPTAVPTSVSPTAPSVDAATQDRQRRVFEAFWRTVNENYLYADFNGYDWSAFWTRTNAQIDSGITDEAFYQTLSEGIVALNDDHSSFLSPTDAREEDAEYNGTYEYAGVGVIADSLTDKRVVVIHQVLPGSPAEQAGLRPHDSLLQINGQPVFKEDGTSRQRELRGEAGTTVEVEVRTPGQNPRVLVLTRQRINSSEKVVWRFLPNASGRRLAYLLIPTLFQDDITQQVRDALRAMTREGRLDGLVIDMRINGGGALSVLRPTLGFFTRGDIGRLVGRKGTRLTINTRAEGISNSQTVPLVVLTSPSTASFAEVFSGALQAKGRATLIGRPSAGNIETLNLHEFEDGSRMWLAEEGFRLMNGEQWEGIGLTPDVRVETPWEDHAADDDPLIAAAVTQLSQ